MMHDLKTWPEPFADIWAGRKSYEVRKADRPFKVGDHLRLYEWDPATGRDSGREVGARVTHVLHKGTYW